MESSLSKWFSPTATVVSVGLLWGMIYALLEGLSIAATARTGAELGASLALLLSLMVLYGLVFGLLSLPIGLLVSLLVQRRRSDPNHPVIAGICGGFLTGIAAMLVWIDQFNLGFTLGLSFSMGYLVPRVVVGLGALLLAILSGWAIYALSAVWKSKLRKRTPLSGRAVVLAVWAGICLLAVVMARSQRTSFGSGSANSGSSADLNAGDRPNVVILSIDALRADHVGCYGYDQEITPNIDMLAGRGIRYQNAVTQAPWTLPSFASMFTSLYPTELDIPGAERTINDMTGVRIDSLRTTLAEVFQQEGYRTQAIITNPWLDPTFGFEQGFDGFIRVDKSPTSFGRLEDVFLVNLLQRFWNPGYQALERLHQAIWGASGQGWDTTAEEINDHVIRWLRKAHQEPFFLWVHYIDPHAPYDPPDRYMPAIEEITPERFHFLRRAFNQLLDDSARIRPADNRTLIALYDAEIRAADEAVGGIVAEIDRLGLRDRTIIVVLADHGEEFLDHGEFVHGHALYQELTSVPLIIAGPEKWVGQPRVVDEPAGLIDVMPTLLALAGASNPEGIEGQDLFLAEKAAGSSSRPYQYSEGLNLGPERKMVRNGQHKLILDPYTGKTELYDLQADPKEQADISSQEPGVVAALRGALVAWMDHTTTVAAELPRSGGSPSPGASLLDELEAGGY